MTPISLLLQGSMHHNFVCCGGIQKMSRMFHSDASLIVTVAFGSPVFCVFSLCQR